jgi:hypothetical protein
MAATNTRQNYKEVGSILAPATEAFAVTPNDGVDLPNGATKTIFVGGAGALKVDMYGGQTVTFSAVPAGTLLPIRARRIWATGTVATLILALY